jgi:hypothetical protein
MDLVVWLRGRMCLQCHELFSDMRLPIIQALRIDAGMYTWSFFSQERCIYARIFLHKPWRKFVYIGSSVHNLASRERTRWGKYKQVMAGTPVSVELALHWHHQHCNYDLCIPRVFMHSPELRCLHSVEQFWIQALSARLNSPLVQWYLRKADMLSVSVR